MFSLFSNIVFYLQGYEKEFCNAAMLKCLPQLLRMLRAQQRRESVKEDQKLLKYNNLNNLNDNYDPLEDEVF